MKFETNDVVGFDSVGFRIKRDDSTGTLIINSNGINLNVDITKPLSSVDDGLKDLALQILKS